MPERKGSFNVFGAPTLRDVKVGYISTETGYVSGVGLWDANVYAKKNPGTTFIFNTRDKTQYLNINEVNKLTVDDLPRGQDGCGGAEIFKKDSEDKDPKIIFAGGGGVGAKANPVIGQDGSLLGVHLVSGGFGYKYPPHVSIEDPTGYASGAVIRCGIGTTVTTYQTYDDEEDFEEYFPPHIMKLAPPNIGFGDEFIAGKNIGPWNPYKYVDSQQTPFETTVKNYMKELREVQSPWWTTHEAPSKVTGDNRTTKTFYKVHHWAWGAKTGTNDEIDNLYIKLFGRRGEPSGLAYWKNLRESGQSLAVIEQDMKRQPEWKKVQEEGTPVMSDVTYKFGAYWEFDKDNFMNSYAISPVPMSKSKASDFSGRWYTFEWDDVEFPYDGEYNFRVQCDNEARFFLDNQAVSEFKIGAGGAAGSVLSNPLHFKETIKKGKHSFKLELYNHPKIEDVTVQEISTRQEIQVAGGDFILKSNGYHLAVGGNEETELVLTLEYNDNPRTAGTAVTKITIPNPNGPDLVLEREKDSNGNFKTKGSVSAKGVFKRSEFGYGPFIVEGNSGSTKLVRQNLTYGVNSVKYGQIDFLDSHGSDINGSLKLVSAKNLQESRTIIEAPLSSESTKFKTVFNTVDYINKANRKLWRINSGSGQGFINDYGICPFDTTVVLPDNPYSGTHEIRWFNVNFPVSGNYIIEIQVDDNVNLRIGDEVEIRKEGFTIVKGRYRSTGKLREVHYIKEGTYNIFAGLEQIPGGKFGFGKGLNPMALAINITTAFTKEKKVKKESWNKNPMGVAMTIDAPNPPIPQQPKPVQEGRCPPNPFWTTRFPGGTAQWHPVYVEGWSKFLNKHAMSPVPPYDIDSTSGGGVPFENEWTVDIPYDGFYKLKGSADDNSQFYIDDKLELETKRSGKVQDETMVFLNEGTSKIRVVVENYLFEEKNLIDQKIFNAADWANAGDGTRSKTQLVDFNVTTSTAFINSIEIKGLFYEQGPKLIAGEDIITPPPQVKPAVDADVEFIKRDSNYFMKVTGNDLVEVGFDFRYVAPPPTPDPEPIDATMKFVKKSGKYFLQVTGNYLVDVALEFRYHEDDPEFGGGEAVTSITVKTEGAPLTFEKTDGPRIMLDGWPGRGGAVTQNGTFINGREYEVTFSTISGASDPIIGPAGNLDNTSTDDPDQRLNFFDTDTSGGATSGPDIFGDARAYFTATSITQLSNPPVPASTASPVAIQGITIQTNGSPLTFRRTDGPRDLSGWPGRGGSVVKKAIFKNGIEYPISFTGRVSGSSDPIIGPAGSLDNVSQEKPNKRINFFDTDTSGGATSGPDIFGDARAYFTATNIKQLSTPEVQTFESFSVAKTALRQLDGKPTITRQVEMGREYIVEVKNAGQGMMGNYPAPVGALKADGGVLMLEDIPNVASEDQGGITFDDLVCKASHGKFYDIKGNICKFKIDSSEASVNVQKGTVTYDGPKLYRYAYKSYGEFMKKSGVAPDYPVGGSGQIVNYVWSNIDFPADDTYKFVFAHDAHGSVYLDGKEIIIGDFDTLAGVSARDEANWDPGITKMIKVTKGKHQVAVAPSFGNLGKTNIHADGLFKKLSPDYYRGQQAWNNNPSGMALSITRKVDVNVAAGKKPKHKSWKQNPVGVSGILIPPPCPKVVGGTGVVIDPRPIVPGNGFRPPTGPGYPVGLKLTRIDIDTPGINYNPDDPVEIDGPATAHICEMDSYGRIKKICIDDSGVGFTDYPRIRIPSPTGSGFRGIPIIEVVPDPVEPSLRDKLLQVTDLVGIKQTGYYDGRPYYGAIFYKDGVKYAGYYETPGVLVQIYDTLQESIDAQVTTPASAILRQGTDISSDNPRLDIPGTPDNLT